VGFKEGHQKQGGRQKGTPNRTTATLRKTVSQFLEKNLADVQSIYDKAGERDKLSFLVQLLKFALPTLQSVEMQSELEALSDEQLTKLYNDLKAEMLANLENNGRQEE